MRFHRLTLAAVIAAVPVLAHAQPIQGIYLGAGAGYNLPEDIDVKTKAPVSPPAKLWTQGGVAAVGSVGYGFGNGWRIELEGSYRRTGVNKVTGGSTVATASGGLNTYALMANGVFDFDVGLPWLYPFVGGGAGYAWTNMSGLTINSPPDPPFPAATAHSSGTAGSFAYQVIAGLAFPLPNMPGLSITSQYRFFGTTADGTYHETNTNGPMPNSFTIHKQQDHSFLIGVRYAFGVVPPAAEAPAATPVAAVQASRSYLVFFDWDKATLTDRARGIIKDAATNSTKVQYTRIEVNGYTDTSGTPQYNQGLSIRRAEAVAAELVKDGVPKSGIAIQGFGDTHLLVATGPGVREPQNRRVEIVIK